MGTSERIRAKSMRVIAYLNGGQWRREDYDCDRLAVYSPPRPDGFQLLVPTGNSFVDHDEYMLTAAIESIADYEGREITEVLRDVCDEHA